MGKSRTKKSELKWVLVAVAMMLLCVPANSMTKIAAVELDGLTISAIRYALATIAMAPIVIPTLRKHRKIIVKKLLPMVLLVLPLTAAAPIAAVAIKESSASFGAIMELFIPILFVIISTIVVRDRITKPAIVGLLFAVLGAMVIVVLPMLTGSSDSLQFGWLPLVLMAIFVIIDAFVPIYYRKFNEDGVPLIAVVFVAFLVTAIVAAVLSVAVNGPETIENIPKMQPIAWLALAYNALITSVLARYFNTRAYENVGAMTYGAINYIYLILAIALPAFMLGETLPWEIYVGAGLVLVGVTATRFHPHKHAHGLHTKSNL